EVGLEEEMVAIAEERLAVSDQGDQRRLVVWADEQDNLRQGVLISRGYVRIDTPAYLRRRSLEGRIPEVGAAPGYVVWPLADGAELLERCYASGLAFHPGEVRYAVENREDVSWYRNLQNAPLYRRDLDLVVIAPDGAVASFCTVWFDDVTRSGAFEPVGTVPAHQRRGLGKAVMCEGLRRLRRMGATAAYVGSYDRPAHALHEAVGFTEHHLCEPWLRDL
ncbi:MAG: GNAT family N-acetyltransferase, partial [Anaerolineae bacterium]